MWVALPRGLRRRRDAADRAHLGDSEVLSARGFKRVGSLPPPPSPTRTRTRTPDPSSPLVAHRPQEHAAAVMEEQLAPRPQLDAHLLAPRLSGVPTARQMCPTPPRGSRRAAATAGSY
jgi:hypothetical protein